MTEDSNEIVTRIDNSINTAAEKYVEMAVEWIVKSELNFYEKGGVKDRKLTINGHRIPCHKCGCRNSRRFAPGTKPICEKCWDKRIEIGLNELLLATMLETMLGISYCPPSTNVAEGEE